MASTSRLLLSQGTVLLRSIFTSPVLRRGVPKVMSGTAQVYLQES